MNQSLSRRSIARHVADKLAQNPNDRAEIVQSIAAYLVHHNRSTEAALLVRDIEHELLVRDAVLYGTIMTARPLTDELKTKLTEYLQQQTNSQKVSLHEEVDPSLIGGFVVQTADGTWDESVRTKLKRIANIE